MADEPSQAPQEATSEDKPDESQQQAPEQEGQATEAQQQDGFDYDSLPPEIRSQYDLMRADYTRKMQEIGQERALLQALQSEDPEEYNAALEHLGFDVEQDEDEDEDYDEDDYPEQEEGESDSQYAQRIEALEEQIAARDFADYCEEQVEQIEGHIGRELDDDEAEDLVDTAIRLGDEQGFDEPDWAGAVERLSKREGQISKRLVESKKSAARAPQGTAGSEKFDPSNQEERINRMAAAYDAHQAE